MSKKTISLILIFITLFIYGCDTSTNDNQHQVASAPPPVVMYYKTIPVKIVRIFNQGNYMNKRYHTSIEVESKEYNLHETFTLRGDLMHADDYLKEIFNKEIKEGDIVHAEILSWKQGNKIIKREISGLVKE